MARRSLTGQLNMFDFFSSEEGETGEVEMISFGPNFDEESEVEETKTDEEEIEPEMEVVIEPVVQEEIEESQITRKSDEQVAMSRTYKVEGTTLEIAYINYNKVRITRGNEISQIQVFASSKEAVDYYVEKMQEYEAED